MKVEDAKICPDCDEVYEGQFCPGCGHMGESLALARYLKSRKDAEPFKNRKRRAADVKNPGILGKALLETEKYSKGDQVVVRDGTLEMQGEIIEKNGVGAVVLIEGTKVKALYSHMRRAA